LTFAFYRKTTYGIDSAAVRGHGLIVGDLCNSIVGSGYADLKMIPSLLRKAEILNRKHPLPLVYND
jgi:hypothetical protein